MSPAELLALAEAAEALARLARAASAQEASSALVPVRSAARIAATSPRVINEAIRTGDLAAYGGQRDRAVRMEDLARWIESRKVQLDGPEDADIERRMRRLTRAAAR